MVVGAGTGTVALAAEAGVPTAVSEETRQAETREEAPAQEGDFQWEETEDGTVTITSYTGEGGAVEIHSAVPLCRWGKLYQRLRDWKNHYL